MRTRRTWTAEQKLAILKEAEEIGVTATIRKHQIYGNTLYQWRDRYQSRGSAGLKETYLQVDPDVKRLEQENRQLKEILAEKELALRIKDELLKKTLVRRKNEE